MNKELTQRFLKEVLDYNPASGVLVWRKSRGSVKTGTVAGSEWLSKDGKRYRQIRILGSLYYAHRIVFLYVDGCMPSEEVDHINGNGLDNRWCNLRLVSSSLNRRNTRLSRQNTSGVVGVSWLDDKKKFFAQIKINRETKFLGYHNDLISAVAARKNAEVKYGFHRNHGSIRPL